MDSHYNDPTTRSGAESRSAYARASIDDREVSDRPGNRDDSPGARTLHSPAPKTSITHEDDGGRLSGLRDRASNVKDRVGSRVRNRAGDVRDRVRNRAGDVRDSARERAGDLQERLTEMLDVRDLDDLTERVRANPLAAVAVAAGVGFLLQRTHLLGGVASAVAGGVNMVTPDRDLSPAEERLLAWLNDAHAMELALIPVLENHADDARRRPEVRERDLEHLEQTERHVKLVKKCIRMLGHSPSKVKDAVGAMSGMMNSVSTEPFDDEVVRNFLADFAAENLEIASYRALIVAAEEAGHPKIAAICEEILEDELDMADWIHDNLPNAVRDTFDELNLHASRR